jgi:hypothetical protein
MCRVSWLVSVEDPRVGKLHCFLLFWVTSTKPVDKCCLMDTVHLLDIDPGSGLPVSETTSCSRNLSKIRGINQPYLSVNWNKYFNWWNFRFSWQLISYWSLFGFGTVCICLYKPSISLPCSFIPWRWRQHVSPKHWHEPTNPHGAKTQDLTSTSALTLLHVTQW